MGGKGSRRGTDIIGWVFHADVFCNDCGNTFPGVDPEGNVRFPIFGTDEQGYFDSERGGIVPYVCGQCEAPVFEW